MLDRGIYRWRLIGLVATVNPSSWILSHLKALSPGRSIDVAAGSGRHAFAMADLGFSVTAVDRNPDFASLYQESVVQFICADLEGQQWPLADHTYDLVLVSNYLHRPYFAELFQLVAPGGYLVYETFGVGNEIFGKPSNPEFLLKPRELTRALESSFEIMDERFETVSSPSPAVRAGVFARRIR